jgi:hypothetical protein
MPKIRLSKTWKIDEEREEEEEQSEEEEELKKFIIDQVKHIDGRARELILGARVDQICEFLRAYDSRLPIVGLRAVATNFVRFIRFSSRFDPEDLDYSFALYCHYKYGWPEVLDIAILSTLRNGVDLQSLQLLTVPLEMPTDIEGTCLIKLNGRSWNSHFKDLNILLSYNLAVPKLLKADLSPEFIQKVSNQNSKKEYE